MRKITLVLATLTVSLSSTIYSASNNFNCPAPAEIQSTDFTAPSIWIAPPVAQSTPDTVGVGFGGKEVKEFLGAEAVNMNNHDGWVCVYKTKGGVAPNEYQRKIREVIAGNKLLGKYMEKVNRAFEEAEPYLKNFPQDEPLGFVGYVFAEQPIRKKK